MLWWSAVTGDRLRSPPRGAQWRAGPRRRSALTPLPPLSPPQTNSGKLESGSYCLNSNKGKKERIGRLMIMHANNREDIKTAYAGDIIAIGGLKVRLMQSLSVCVFVLRGVLWWEGLLIRFVCARNRELYPRSPGKPAPNSRCSTFNRHRT